MNDMKENITSACDEYLNKLEDNFLFHWLFDEKFYDSWFNGDIDDKTVFETIPPRLNIEGFIDRCLGRNALICMCHSRKDLYEKTQTENLLNILIRADLTTLNHVNERYDEIFIEVENWYVSGCPD
jgi:hypothetical protein